VNLIQPKDGRLPPLAVVAVLKYFAQYELRVIIAPLRSVLEFASAMKQLGDAWTGKRSVQRELNGAQCIERKFGIDQKIYDALSNAGAKNNAKPTANITTAWTPRMTLSHAGSGFDRGASRPAVRSWRMTRMLIRRGTSV
jgi:hypothetical protein